MAFIVLVASLLLVQLPSLAGSLLVQFLALSVFGGVVVWNLLLISQHPARIEPALERLRSNLLGWFAFFGYLALHTVALARATTTGTISLTEAVFQVTLLWSAWTFAVTAFLIAHSRWPRMADGVLYAVAAYVGLAAGLYHLGMRNVAVEDPGLNTTARMLSLFGIQAERVVFPMAFGLNPFAIIGGVAMTGAIVVGFQRGVSLGRRVAVLAAGVLGAYAVLRTDSRATMFFAVLSGVLVAVLPMRFYRSLRLSVFVAPLLPVLVMAFGLWASTRVGNSPLLRDATELSTAGRRALVWGAVIAELADAQPIHAIGYGHFGQTHSAVVQRFGDIVGRGYDTSRLTAHNLVFQELLDVGYLGAVFLLLCFWCGMTAMARGPDSPVKRLLMALLLYLLVSGTTEASPTAYNRASLVIFIFVLCASLSFGKNEGDSDDGADPVATPGPLSA
jgi:O-antigen ligase